MPHPPGAATNGGPRTRTAGAARRTTCGTPGPHLAEKGRSAPESQAESRHKHLGTPGHYVKLGDEISARVTAENDEHDCRRRR